jgi:putative ABC transport system substrate-binding protein
MKGLVLAFGITLAFVALASPIEPEAEQTAKVPRIGHLGTSPNPDLTEAFRQGLRDLGYVEGRNVVIEYRNADRKVDRLPALAAELVALKVDVLVTAGGTPAALAAKQASRTLPIVFTDAGDPVTAELVRSLARPGATVTGLSILFPELMSKCLEYLSEAIPRLTRVAVLWQPGVAPERYETLLLKEAGVTARRLGMRPQFVRARSPAEFDRAFSEMNNGRVSGLAVLSSSMFVSERRRLADLALKSRLPAVFSFRTYVDAGGLTSYGPHLPDPHRRAAACVDKILKGTKPGDLPVEQPTKFELVINLKTAKALSLTIPPSVLLRADNVVEK